MGGATFYTIISTLDELGYDCQWQVLNSKDFGVPQNRERILIVGHLRGTPRPEVFPLKKTDGATDKRLKSGNSAREVAQTIRQRYGNGTGSHIQQLNNPRHSNDRVYGTDGISPTINTMQGGNRQPFIKIPEATKKGYAEAKVGQSINLAVPNSKTRRGRVSDVAQTLDTGMQQHTLTKDMQVRRLTPTECERLQGFPDGWTAEGVTAWRDPIVKANKHIPKGRALKLATLDFEIGRISDTQRYKTLGNAVTTNVIQAVMERIL